MFCEFRQPGLVLDSILYKLIKKNEIFRFRTFFVCLVICSIKCNKVSNYRLRAEKYEEMLILVLSSISCGCAQVNVSVHHDHYD